MPNFKLAGGCRDKAFEALAEDKTNAHAAEDGGNSVFFHAFSGHAAWTFDLQDLPLLIFLELVSPENKE